MMNTPTPENLEKYIIRPIILQLLHDLAFEYHEGIDCLPAEAREAFGKLIDRMGTKDAPTGTLDEEEQILLKTFQEVTIKVLEEVGDEVEDFFENQHSPMDIPQTPEGRLLLLTKVLIQDILANSLCHSSILSPIQKAQLYPIAQENRLEAAFYAKQLSLSIEEMESGISKALLEALRMIEATVPPHYHYPLDEKIATELAVFAQELKSPREESIKLSRRLEGMMTDLIKKYNLFNESATIQNTLNLRNKPTFNGIEIDAESLVEDTCSLTNTLLRFEAYISSTEKKWANFPLEAIKSAKQGAHQILDKEATKEYLNTIVEEQRDKPHLTSVQAQRLIQLKEKQLELLQKQLEIHTQEAKCHDALVKVADKIKGMPDLKDIFDITQKALQDS